MTYNNSKELMQQMVGKKVLFLTIRRKPFDLIAAGIKKEEYRDVTPFFDKKLIGKNYDLILFQNGYSPSSPRMLVEYRGYEKKVPGQIRFEKILYDYEEVNYFAELSYAIKLGPILAITL